MGQQFNAVLIYRDAAGTVNSYEGFFLVDDTILKAYTVYPPAGPYQNQIHYFMEVLQSVIGASRRQYWVWAGDQTINGVTVIGYAPVPSDIPGSGIVLLPNIP